MNKRALYLSLFITGVLIIAAVVIAYARGYRPDLKSQKLKPTGLLVATSYPDGAQVFVNGVLKTATNNTINLIPGWYDIKIVKDGFFPWEKKLRVQGEIVTKTEALLLSTTPSLRALTNAGVLNPILSPDGNRIVYGSATASAEKQGVYIMDLNDRSILKAVNRQISRDTLYVNLSRANYLWSPDGKKVMAYFNSEPEVLDPTAPAQNFSAVYLLDTNVLNEVPEDITLTYQTTLIEWDGELAINENQRINSLKSRKLRELVRSWQVLSWSPNETKILYTATESATIPLIIKPPLIGANSQKEERNLVSGKIYIYNIKEDKNYEIGDLNDLFPDYSLSSISSDRYLPIPLSPLQWLPESYHLVLVQNGKIYIMEYDGYNKTVVYAGPLSDNAVFPWPDSSRLVILTNYNPAQPEANLYSVTLR